MLIVYPLQRKVKTVHPLSWLHFVKRIVGGILNPMNSSSKKILLIEDSKPLRQVLGERLVAAGFTVSEASSGEEGLRIALEEKPDLIVTDIIMFPLDGLELAKQVRESGVWGEQVHIVALTNQDSEQEKTRVEPLHLSAYIVKAETPLDEIVKKVQRLFKEKN